MKKVILESPFAAKDQWTVEDNIKYARLCMRDCLLRNESPYASHLLYTQEGVLDDLMPEERELGIKAGFEWKHSEDVTTVFYINRGFTKGMRLALDYCEENKMDYELRYLDGGDA